MLLNFANPKVLTQLQPIILVLLLLKCRIFWLILQMRFSRSQKCKICAATGHKKYRQLYIICKCQALANFDNQMAKADFAHCLHICIYWKTFAPSSGLFWTSFVALPIQPSHVVLAKSSRWRLEFAVNKWVLPVSFPHWITAALFLFVMPLFNCSLSALHS